MTPADAEALLRAAREERRTVAPFTDADAGLDESWGEAVQQLDRAHREARGEVVVGAKLGLTSEAKQRRMGLDRPIVGFLTDAHLAAPDDLAPRLGRWAQPRVEPEVAFRLGRDLVGPVDLAGAAALVDGVAVAAEVLDSRFTGYRFGLPDVLADDTSAAGVVLGPWLPLGDPDDLPALACELEVDGEVVATATGAAVLGHPLRALVHLAEHLARHGRTLPAGSVVLAGALTDAVPLLAGHDHVVRMGRLGTLHLTT